MRTQRSEGEVRSVELGSKFKKHLDSSIGIVDQHGVIFGDVERLMLWTLTLRVSVGLKGSQL